MARTPLPVMPAARTGTQLAFTPSDQVNGNSFLNDGQTVLIVRNPTGAPINITLRTTLVADGDLKLPDRVVSVPNGIVALLLGAFVQGTYNQADGSVFVDCAAILQLVAISIG